MTSKGVLRKAVAPHPSRSPFTKEPGHHVASRFKARCCGSRLGAVRTWRPDVLHPVPLRAARRWLSLHGLPRVRLQVRLLWSDRCRRDQLPALLSLTSAAAIVCKLAVAGVRGPKSCRATSAAAVDHDRDHDHDREYDLVNRVCETAFKKNYYRHNTAAGVMGCRSRRPRLRWRHHLTARCAKLATLALVTKYPFFLRRGNGLALAVATIV